MRLASSEMSRELALGEEVFTMQLLLSGRVMDVFEFTSQSGVR